MIAELMATDRKAYVLRSEANYWGVSGETHFLHCRIDPEYEQCRQAA